MKEQVITVLGVYDIDYSDEREAYIVSYKGKLLFERGCFNIY